MSHSALINGLSDGLVQHVYDSDESSRIYDEHAISQARTFAQKGVRSAQFARVNQFEVNSRLDGLVEKFALLNNDALSEALQTRLDELAAVSDKFTPELLALFLALSDKPSEKILLRDIGINQESEPEPSITWAQILAEDPYSDDELWRDVEAESETSEEDLYDRVNDRVLPRRRSQSSSVIDEDISHALQHFTVTSGEDALAKLRSARNSGQSLSGLSNNRQQRLRSESIRSTEVEIIRELLYQVRGYPSTIVAEDGMRRYLLQSNLSTSSMTSQTLRSICNDLLDVSSRLQFLRRWCRTPQTVPLCQRYQSTVLSRLAAFDNDVTTLEQRFVRPKIDTVVSIQQVSSCVEEASRPILRLHELVEAHDRSQSPIWALVDDIYQESCIAQMTDQSEDFEYFAKLFFDCLSAYMEPLRLWISEGKLLDRDGSSFVTADYSGSEAQQSSLWRDQYSMRTSADGSVVSPSFIRDLAKTIFATGKSVMFLRAISPGEEPIDDEDVPYNELSFESVCEPVQSSPLWSFQELLHDALDSWILANARSKQVALRNSILHQHGLLSFLKSLSPLFLSKDGASFDSFAAALFTRLHDQRLHWHDPFVLTSLAQTAFSPYLTSADRLSVRVNRRGCKTGPAMTRLLPLVKLYYAIPWQLQNVTREAFPSAVQDVFILLLQISRVQFLVKPLTIPSDIRLRTAGTGIPQALGLKQRLLWYSLTLQDHICQTTQQTVAEAVVKTENSAGIDEMSAAYTDMNNDLRTRSLLRRDLLVINRALIAALEVAEGFSRVWRQSQLGDETVDASESISEKPKYDIGYHNREGKQVTDDVAEAMDGLKRAFDRHFDFAVTGLRSIARVGGEESWGVLVEKLEMGSNTNTL